MVLIPEIRSIDFSIPISSVSSILFLVEPKRTGHISIGYLAFHFRPSNREQDINLNDFHYSRPSNEIIRMHILCTHRFLFVLVYLYNACNVIKPCIHTHHAFCMSFLWTACRYLCRFIKLFVNVL